jgi:Ni/Co efflux regulator RcnB
MTDPLRDAIEALRMPPRVGTQSHHAMRIGHNAALDAVLAILDAQPKQPTREQIEALKQRVPVRVGGDNMDLAAGWTAALDAVFVLFKEVPDVLSAAKKGKTVSPETRAKMSAAQKGKTVSPETRAKMSAAKKGKTVSPETRAKMSAAKKGKTLSPETRAKMSAAHKGKTLSPETRAKMSAAQKGKTLSPETRAKMSAATKAAKRPKRIARLEAELAALKGEQ